MGWGDDLMALGEARYLHECTGRRVCIGRSRSRPAHSPMFENVEWLDQSGAAGQGVALLANYIGRRPYYDYQRSSGARQSVVESYRPRPGVLEFSDAELKAAEELVPHEPGSQRVFLEPHVKGTFSGENKRWPWLRWCELTERLGPDWPLVQISKPGTQGLPGVPRIGTDRVRVALATLKWAALLVTTDGLLHHAAAAMGVPAVVLWGARTDPRVLGYPFQVNIASGSDWCGARQRCEHCERAMARIGVEEVERRVREELGL